MASLAAITVVILHGTFVAAFLVLASLSRIFGAAKRKRPLYKAFYWCGGAVSAAGLAWLALPGVPAAAVAAVAVDVAAMAAGAAVTRFYWDWLPKETARR